MKKVLALTLALIMLFGFTGCNKNSDKKADEKQSKKTGQTEPSKTIVASNKDKIDIELKNGENPTVSVKVNDKEIYKNDNLNKYQDQYDFDKDFNLEIKAEYSDEKIFWAYRFDWGVIYSTKNDYYDTVDTDDSIPLVYVCPKHDYKKSYFKNSRYYILAEEWDLIEFDAVEETGKKIFWDSYTAAQVIFESFYKTENYTLKEIDNLEKAGYSLDDYYEMHDREFGSGAGMNNWEKIYEVSVNGEPFALLYSDASTASFLLQELTWENPSTAMYLNTKDGPQYFLSPERELTEIS